jgi:hypothetical protein
MIRYFSNSCANVRSPSKGTYLDQLAADYRELQELRERVRKAEAAAAKAAAMAHRKINPQAG